MRITFIAPYFGLNGGNRVTAIYAGLLRKRGHEVLVISQPLPTPGLKAQVRSLMPFNLASAPIHGDILLEDLDVEHKVLETCRPVVDDDVPDADVIIATWWETAYWAASLSEIKGRKFYFVQHHEVHNHLPWQISRGTYYLPLKKITISKWLVDTMAQVYGDHDVALIHNSVDMRQFHAESRGRQSAPTVGLLYSTTHFKGVDVSLKAIEKTKERLPDLKLIAFGTQDPSPNLPLPTYAHYHRNPAQAKIRDIYAACDVWLCGSRAEGFHLPPLEAMACRCPVVSTCVGGPMDIIQDGVNGYIVNTEDSNALSDRLVAMFELPPEKWRAMSDAALAVAEGYTWADAAGQFESILMESQS